MGTPCGARTVPARKSPMFFISYRARAGPGTGVVFGRTGPVRAPQGLFMGCLQSLNLYGARNLIMHALKLYGEAKFVRRRTGQAPWVDVRFLFKTAREQPVRGPGVWCDWGITHITRLRSYWLKLEDQIYISKTQQITKISKYRNDSPIYVNDKCIWYICQLDCRMYTIPIEIQGWGSSIFNISCQTLHKVCVTKEHPLQIWKIFFLC